MIKTIYLYKTSGFFRIPLLLVIILSAIGSRVGYGQQESVFAHVGKEMLIPGERLPLSIYVTSNASPAQQSSVAYIDLINSEGAVIANWRTTVVSGQAAVNLSIPKVPTGVYLLRIYTHQSNKETAFCQQLFLNNPSQVTPKEISRFSIKDKSIKQAKNPVKVQNLNASYATSDSIHFQLKLENAKMGNLSCLIALRDTPEFLAAEHIPKNVAESSAKKNILENGAWYFSGSVSDAKSGQTIGNQKVVLSVIGETPVYQYTYTQSNGAFHFWLDKRYDNSQLILQLESDTISPIQLHWKIDPDFSLASDYITAQVCISDEDKTLVEQSGKLALINKVYYKQVFPAAYRSEEKIAFIPYLPDYVRELSDYAEVKDFKEIADNILPLVNLHQVNQKWQIDIFDKKGQRQLYKAQVFLNGIPFYDMDYLISLPKKNIKEVEVYQSEFVYGNVNFNGIVHVITTDGKIPEKYNASVFVYDNKVLETNRRIIIAGRKETDRSGKFPFFSPLLYWNPDIQLGNNAAIDLKIPTSDLPGTYKVELMGIVDGEPVVFEKEISVSDE